MFPGVYLGACQTYGVAWRSSGGLMAFTIRAGRKGDEDLIFTLLYELAEYEKLLDRFHMTRETIARDCLGEPPRLSCNLACEGDAAVGIATWYWTYAGFAAAPGLYLEDLYVRPQYRGRGCGKALLAHLAKMAADAGAVRIDWLVLDWNKPSIDFYESLGATRSNGWYTYRLEGEALKKMGR